MESNYFTLIAAIINFTLLIALLIAIYKVIQFFKNCFNMKKNMNKKIKEESLEVPREINWNIYSIRESNSDEAKIIVDSLVEYNLTKVPLIQETPNIWINRVAEDMDGNIIAGINSRMYCWNCLYIDILWVKEEYRKSGLGSKLLNEVERIAKDKGCNIIHLDTFDFQAKDFYIKHGYDIFGILDDCPREHKRYYLKKML